MDRAEREGELKRQRDRAAEQGLPYAVTAGFAPPWDTGAPVPVLLSGLRTFVAYYLNASAPWFDGTNPRRRSPVCQDELRH